MRLNFLVLGVILILGAVAVSGCTSQSTNTITIQNSSFNPSMLTIQAGTTVTWINKANGTMDVTSDSGLFSSGNLTNGRVLTTLLIIQEPSHIILQSIHQ